MLILIILAINVSIFGQSDSARFKELEMKVKLIEEYKSNIEQYSKIELEKHKSELKENFENDYRNIRNLFVFILIIGIPSSISGIYFMFWGLNKKIKKIVGEKIESIVELKREDIIRLIDNQTFDRKIKETKKILIISETEDAQEDIRSTMSKMGFKKLIFRLTKTTSVWPENDLIIINNIDGEFSQADINQIIDENKDEDTFFVAYTSKQIERTSKMNFANSKFTLYHAILSTLAFISSIKEND